MPTEFQTRYCPHCDETVHASRQVPFWGRGLVLLHWLLGKSSAWRCSQCGGLIPLAPEERRRHIAMAVFVSLPLVALLVLLLVLILIRD